MAQKINQAQLKAARDAGYSDEEIASHLKSAGYSPEDLAVLSAPDFGDVQSGSSVSAPKEDLRYDPRAGGGYNPSKGERLPLFEDALAANIPNVRTGASLATGAAATQALKSPLAGNIAMTATDELLRYFATGEKSGVPGAESLGLETPLSTIPLGVAENEVGGRIIGKAAQGVKALGSAGKEFLATSPSMVARAARSVVGQPTPIVDPALAALKPTFSQHFEYSPKSDFIENTLGRERKQQAMEVTDKLITKAAEKKIKEVSTRTTQLASSREYLGQSAQNRIISQFDDSVAASREGAKALNLVAKANVTPSGLEGPVNITTTIQKAKEYLDDAANGLVKADPENPLIKAATTIIQDSKASFDDAGKLIYYEPIPFKQAWQFKKDAGEFAFGSPKSDVGVVDAKFRPLFYSLDKDIEDSTLQWGVDGKAAHSLYGKVKGLVNQRHELFSPGGIATSNTKVLLNNLDRSNAAKQSIISEIDRRIDDPALLQRTLDIGALNFQAGGQKIVTNNLKKDLQAYQLKRMFQDAVQRDEFGRETFNAKSLWDAWKANEQSESLKKLYNAKQRDDIQQFFKNISFASQKPGQTGTHWLQFTGATKTFNLGGGLLTYALTENKPIGSILTSGGFVSGILGLNSLSKLLTNPDTARIMVAAAQGSGLGNSAKYASRAIFKVLAGETIKIKTPDGNEVQGTIDKDGKFQEESK